MWTHKDGKVPSFSHTHTHLQSCWGILWRYFCIVCPQSGSILHICRRTHMVVYRICWWEPQTPCPRRHTLPWECTVSSSILTLCLHKTSRKANVTAIQLCSCAHGGRCTHPTQVSSSCFVCYHLIANINRVDLDNTEQNNLGFISFQGTHQSLTRLQLEAYLKFQLTSCPLFWTEGQN